MCVEFWIDMKGYRKVSAFNTHVTHPCWRDSSFQMNVLAGLGSWDQSQCVNVNHVVEVLMFCPILSV